MGIVKFKKLQYVVRNKFYWTIPIPMFLTSYRFFECGLVHSSLFVTAPHERLVRIVFTQGTIVFFSPSTNSQPGYNSKPNFSSSVNIFWSDIALANSVCKSGTIGSIESSVMPPNTSSFFGGAIIL